MLSAARSKRDEEYQEEEDRLVKETEKAIACLSMREFADRDLTAVLSEATEVMLYLEDWKDTLLDGMSRRRRRYS